MLRLYNETFSMTLRLKLEFREIMKKSEEINIKSGLQPVHYFSNVIMSSLTALYSVSDEVLAEKVFMLKVTGSRMTTFVDYSFNLPGSKYTLNLLLLLLTNFVYL